MIHGVLLFESEIIWICDIHLSSLIIFFRTRVILEAEAEAESIKVKEVFIVMNDN